MGCYQKSFILVWCWQQLLSGSLPNGCLPSLVVRLAKNFSPCPHILILNCIIIFHLDFNFIFKISFTKRWILDTSYVLPLSLLPVLMVCLVAMITLKRNACKFLESFPEWSISFILTLCKFIPPELPVSRGIIISKQYTFQDKNEKIKHSLLERITLFSKCQEITVFPVNMAIVTANRESSRREGGKTQKVPKNVLRH